MEHIFCAIKFSSSNNLTDDSDQNPGVKFLLLEKLLSFHKYYNYSVIILVFI
jgi:hypothetical protein